MNKSAPVVIHHGNCVDGVGSAFLLARHLGQPSVIPAQYDDDLPGEVDGSDVYVADFCYGHEQMIQLGERASRVLLMDHHATARDSIPDVYELLPAGPITDRPRLAAVFDMELSGMGIVAACFEDDHWLTKYVQDRDLWKWEIEGGGEVFATITSHPLTIDTFKMVSAAGPDRTISEGRAIVRYRNQLIDYLVSLARPMEVAGHADIWAVASPYMVGSEVAGRLCAERDPERFGAYYIDHPDGVRQWGVRSIDGRSARAAAESMGGGGHGNAAGFRALP